MKLFNQPQVFDLNPNVFWIQVGIEWLAFSFHWFFCVGHFLYHIRIRFCTFFDQKLALQHSSQKNFIHGASISNHIHFHVAFLATWPWQGRKSSTPFESISPPRGWWIMPLQNLVAALHVSLKPAKISGPANLVILHIFNIYMTHLFIRVSVHHTLPNVFFWELIRLYNVIFIFSWLLSSPLVL